jgi:hypothetical protein
MKNNIMIQYGSITRVGSLKSLFPLGILPLDDSLTPFDPWIHPFGEFPNFMDLIGGENPQYRPLVT